jgi:hypothetical protein
MRGFRKTARQRDRTKAFHAGFKALKEDLTVAFRRIGEGQLSGYTALEIVKNSKPDVSRETFT